MRKGILAAAALAVIATAASAPAQTVTVNSAGGADFTTITDALNSFSTSDGFENVISITGFGPYVEAIPEINDSFGTDTLTIRGDLGTTRPLVLIVEANGPDGISIATGGHTVNMEDLIVAAADNPATPSLVVGDDLIRTGGSGVYNFDNILMTALPPLGTGDYATSYTQESDIPAGLLDGTEPFNETAYVSAADNGFRFEGGTNTVNNTIITQQLNDPIVSFSGGADVPFNVLNTTIRNNRGIGIQISEGGAVTIDNCLIEDNGGFAITSFGGAAGGGLATVSDSILRRNAGGVFSLTGDKPWDVIDNEIYDNPGWGIQIFSDGDSMNIQNNFIYNNGSGGALQSYGYDGGNIELLGNNAVQTVLAYNTITSPSTQTDVTFTDPINVRVGRPGDTADNILIENNVIAGPATGGGVGIEILDSTSVATIGRNGTPTAGDGALAVTVQDVDSTSPDVSGLNTEDAAFADASNGDWTPGNFDYAAFGDFPYSYTSQADLTSAPPINGSDDLNSLTAIVVSASGVNDGGLLTSPLTEFTDGSDAVEAGSFPGLLTDFPGAGTPSGSYAYEIVSSASDLADVSEIEVISGWQDGRASHHYDVYGTTDYPVTSGSSFFLIAKGVIPVPFGTANPGAPSTKEYYVTTLTDGDDGIVAEGVTGIRFDFYATGNAAGAYVDPFFSDNPLDVDGFLGGSGPAPAAEGSWIREIDATFTTFNSVSDWSTLE